MASVRWQIGILGVLCSVLDKLTFSWFGAGADNANVHDVLSADGVVVMAQRALLRLLQSWHIDNAEDWRALDGSVGSLRRSDAEEDVRHFLRSNLCRYAAGLHRRYELLLAHNELPLHLAQCEKCSPTEADRIAAWDELDRTARCCKTAFQRKACDMRAECGLTKACLALRMRDRLKLVTTKRSEVAHAHCRRVLGRSDNKPSALATFGRRVFMGRLASTHIQHGGDPGWRRLSNSQLVDAERHSQAQGSGAAPAPLALPSADAADALVSVGNDDSALAACDAPPPPASARAPSCGHLNPVMYFFNQKQKVAKQLGLKVDAEFRAAALAEVRASYADPDLKQSMREEYKKYLEGHESMVKPPPPNKPLESTFWGWGTTSLPVPIHEVQSFIMENGLVSGAAAVDPQANNQFRVMEHEAASVCPLEIAEEFVACGARPYNECRRALRPLPPNSTATPHPTEIRIDHRSL